MKQLFLMVALFCVVKLFASPQAPGNLTVAPGTIGSATASLVWDKPAQYEDIKTYHLFLNGKEVATSDRCNFRLQDLSAGTPYKVYLKSENKAGELSKATAAVRFVTKPKGKVLNVVDFGAKGDGVTLNTKAIQKAIDACPTFGTVLIPEGTFMSGAIFLKSDMILRIAKGGQLKGSSHLEDYLPMIHNRFEGWELDTYASLINAGIMNHKGGYTVENLRICGEGAIVGAGGKLGAAMQAKSGIRSRGRLILLLNCKNVDLQGLTIQNSPCWTIHYVYCKGVSLHDLNISSTARNGDGIDPDSSDDSFIFNCTFSTGDDCIAIKSGKNPEGFYIGKPTRNVKITDCNFVKGHGISIGSEMSGGVSNVLVRDCQAGPLLHGLQIKATKERGGYVKNVKVLDCQLQQITIFSELPYNNDGEAAPEPPVFENYSFKNLDLSSAKRNEAVIDIHGWNQPGHKLQHVTFKDILLPDHATVSIGNAADIEFTDVKTVSGVKPEYHIKGSQDIRY